MRNIALYKKRKQNNLCVFCGNPAVKKTVFCEIHRQKQANRSKKIREFRKTNNLCLDCGKEKEDSRKNFTRCSICDIRQKEAHKKMVKAREDKGLCHCGNIACIGKICEICWFKRISVFNTGSEKNWLAIKQLLEKQNYKCAYTGKQLIPGVNASIDHIIPKKQNGNNTINNLQWIDIQINTKMKFNMSHQEFIELIRHILIYTKNY